MIEKHYYDEILFIYNYLNHVIRTVHLVENFNLFIVKYVVLITF